MIAKIYARVDLCKVYLREKKRSVKTPRRISTAMIDIATLSLKMKLVNKQINLRSVSVFPLLTRILESRQRVPFPSCEY